MVICDNSMQKNNGNNDDFVQNTRHRTMEVSYKKLWKVLIDKDMKKKDLAKAANISNYTITKMSKGENVTVEILGKICTALNCNIDDIMEFIPDNE